MRHSSPWLKSLVATLAPDEMEFFDEWWNAYIAGGEQRRNLLPQLSVAGGYGGETLIVMTPAILFGLAAAAPRAIDLLKQSTFGDLITCVETLIKLLTVREEGKKLAQVKPSVVFTSGPDCESDLSSVQRKLEPWTNFVRFRETLHRELLRNGISQSRAELTSYQVAHRMISDVNEARRTIETLSMPQ